MGKYIIITGSKKKFLISEKESKAVINALNKDAKFVMLQGQIIPLQIIPEILKFETWYIQENERLRLTNKRLCKKCLRTMEMIGPGCDCWNRNSGKGQNIFKPQLPESIKKQIQGTIKEFPKLEEGEIIEENKKQADYIEGPDGELGYKDEESGETMYS